MLADKIAHGRARRVRLVDTDTRRRIGGGAGRRARRVAARDGRRRCRRRRTNTPEDRAALDAARGDVLRARDELVALIDRDAAAYDLVVAAYRNPKGTDEEKAARTAAIQDAMQVATEVPLETVRACAVGRQRRARRRGARQSVRAAATSPSPFRRSCWPCRARMFNVEANLGGLKDPAVVEQVTADLRALQRTMHESGAAIFNDPGLMDLYTQMAKRLGGTHGHGPETEASPKRLALGVAAALRQLGSPEARQALEALARSAEATSPRPRRPASRNSAGRAPT